MRYSVYSTISVPKPPPGKAFCKKARQSFQFLTRFKFSAFSDFYSYFLLYSFFHIRVYRFFDLFIYFAALPRFYISFFMHIFLKFSSKNTCQNSIHAIKYILSLSDTEIQRNIRKCTSSSVGRAPDS